MSQGTKQRKTHTETYRIVNIWPSKYEGSPALVKGELQDGGQVTKSRSFSVWPDNETFRDIEAAHTVGDLVSITYYNKKYTNKQGEEKWDSIPTAVSVVGGGAPSSPPSTEGGWGAPSSPPTVPSGAPATSIDNNKFVAGQLRASAADLNNYADLLEGK